MRTLPNASCIALLVHTFAAPLAHATVQTQVEAFAWTPWNPYPLGETNSTDSPTAVSAAAHAEFEGGSDTEVILFSADSSAAGASRVGELHGTLDSRNSGLVDGVAAYSQANVRNRWDDTLSFHGQGQALMTLAIRGSMSTAGSFASESAPKAASIQTFYEGQLVDAQGGGSQFNGQVSLRSPGSGDFGIPTEGDFLFERDIVFDFDGADNRPTDYRLSIGTSAMVYLAHLDYTVSVKSIEFLQATPDSYIRNADGLILASMNPVPEPATYGMWLAGLCLVGRVARRR